LIIGALTIGSVVFGDYFGDALKVLPSHDVLDHAREEFHGPVQFLVHGLYSVPFGLAAAGVLTAWFLYLKNPQLTTQLRERFAVLHRVLVNKYYFDALNERIIAPATRALGRVFWRVGDETLIDGALVNGSARTVGWMSGVARRVQTGYLYHYAFAMIIGLAALLGWLLTRG
jgi:NADH-quinone oxidoreductase subunit L